MNHENESNLLTRLRVIKYLVQIFLYVNGILCLKIRLFKEQFFFRVIFYMILYIRHLHQFEFVFRAIKYIINVYLKMDKNR
jgi:hypothetical protein